MQEHLTKQQVLVPSTPPPKLAPLSIMAEDEVAAKSGFLCIYMTNHPDTLAAYVMHQTGKKQVYDCRMRAIDSNGFDMEYADAKGGPTQSTRLAFDPPLRGYEEVRPRLLAMKTDAEEAIGMAKRPTLDVYRFPDLHLVAFILPLELLLVYCTLGDRHSAAETIRRFTGGWWTIKAAWLFVFIAHGGEAYYASKLCRRSSMGVINTALWVASTALVGFASLLTLKRLRAEARIASVSKGQ